MTRCRKHCLHSVTPCCRVCCQCGRGVNVSPPMEWPRPETNWEPVELHGPYLIAARLTTYSRPGMTHMFYEGHPMHGNAPLTRITA